VTERSLVTALSRAFVAFTIEIDNEFESRMPHRTAADRGDLSREGPWLTSFTFYSNYLRQIPDEGCPASELARGAGDDRQSIARRLDELRRWGYVRVLPSETDPRDRVVVPTRWGVLARDIWAPIEAQIEERWRARFGPDTVESLRAGLAALPVDPGLPAGFPILAWGRVHETRQSESSGASGLSTLLAHAIRSMARDFDHQAPLSLSMTQNLIRVLDGPVAVRDLPPRAGISREAVAIGDGRLVRSGLATESGSPKTMTLTARGRAAARASLDQRDELDERWAVSPGLSGAFDVIVGPRLAEGLEPPPDGWRAQPPYLAQTRATLADPEAALPAFPMVSHRGGYPDGS
jgi:DNA-binding MarR family transcriptional regulator